ncbi:MAG TPA: cell division protein ZipA [Thiopseudomonas sp.]|nr:cell division protein ZipA [Thiopseudomonas sp.]
MDIGLREWLFVIGIVVIAAVLFDGWRRMRGNKSSLKFRLDRDLADLPEEENPEILGPARRVGKQEPSLSIDDDTLGLHADAEERVEAHPRAVKSEKLKEPELKPVLDEPRIEKEADTAADYEEILIIHVVARSEEGFKGPALLQSILESGLRFGAMDIFHRHENITGNGDKLFSMANALNPGTFDLDDMDLFSTRAVCFFMGLPGPRNSRQAFDLMIAAARKLAEELDGELKDDNRSVLTAQTIEHYRQRIAEFERQKLTKKL